MAVPRKIVNLRMLKVSFFLNTHKVKIPVKKTMVCNLNFLSYILYVYTYVYECVSGHVCVHEKDTICI